MPMYNLIEYTENYSKTSGSLWQHCIDIPAVDNNIAIANFSENKFLSKPELLPQNPNLNHLVEPSFQGVNRLFVLAFENDTQCIISQM